MPEWVIITTIALVVVLYRLKSIHIDFRENDQLHAKTTQRKQLSK
jgi:hypothetical protein